MFHYCIIVWGPYGSVEQPNDSNYLSHRSLVRLQAVMFLYCVYLELNKR